MNKRMFFDIYVKPFKDVYTNTKEKEWRVEEDIEVIGALITISSWEKLPTKVGVCFDSKGIDDGCNLSDNVLACLTTPASGGGTSSLYVPINGRINKDQTITVYVWGHNMNPELHDFHAQIIIYYRLLKTKTTIRLN